MAAESRSTLLSSVAVASAVDVAVTAAVVVTAAVAVVVAAATGDLKPKVAKFCFGRVN